MMPPKPGPEIQKMLLVLGLAIAAAGLYLIVSNVIERYEFWKELDGYRSDSRFADFLEWERSRGQLGDDQEP